MGNRYLRDAILRSDRIGELSDAAQLLFYKLISVVDDFGCFDGRERIIAINAFPLAHREITKELIALQECEAIVRYLNAGKPYIAMMQWGEVTRNYRRKWPAPPVMNDLPGLKYRVPFGAVEDQFHNPRGCDLVSILLDVHGRPTVPQPPEWRRVDTDMMPIGSVIRGEKETPRRTAASPRSTNAARDTQRNTRSMDAAGDTQHVRSASHAAGDVQHDTRSPSFPVPLVPSTIVAAAAVDEPHAAPVLHESSVPTATTPPTNGEIKLLDSGEWHGVSESQRLRWQGMFDGLSIPDQLDRAGAWLLAHPDDRAAYERGERDGFQGFLIRWLLREARGPQAKAS